MADYETYDDLDAPSAPGARGPSARDQARRYAERLEREEVAQAVSDHDAQRRLMQSFEDQGRAAHARKFEGTGVDPERVPASLAPAEIIRRRAEQPRRPPVVGLGQDEWDARVTTDIVRRVLAEAQEREARENEARLLADRDAAWVELVQRAEDLSNQHYRQVEDVAYVLEGTSVLQREFKYVDEEKILEYAIMIYALLQVVADAPHLVMMDAAPGSAQHAAVLNNLWRAVAAQIDVFLEEMSAPESNKARDLEGLRRSYVARLPSDAPTDDEIRDALARMDGDHGAAARLLVLGARGGL